MTNWENSLSRDYFAEFNGRGVMIAGGAAGIGAALADAFSWLGAKVAVIDLNKSAAAVSIAADLTDEQARTAAIAEACAKIGAPAAFISTLGFDNRLGFDLTQEQAEHLMRVNFFAPVFAARDVMPVMRRGGGGAICLFTSRHGSEIFEPDMTGYGCAKAALDSGIKRLAVRAGEDNTPDNIIRVFGFCPGWVQSDSQKARFSAKQFDDAAKEQLIPVGMQPADIVPGIIFGLSKHSRLLSGTTLRFDAGEGQIRKSAVTDGSKKAS
jgi:NAD(P)-dependent dehydrogenase (short-subunit alcohol dehydrogenase family)